MFPRRFVPGVRTASRREIHRRGNQSYRNRQKNHKSRPAAYEQRETLSFMLPGSPAGRQFFQPAGEQALYHLRRCKSHIFCDSSAPYSRLVRKDFGSFRIYAVRDGQRSRRFSLREGISVSLWIFYPQLAFSVLVSLFVGWLRTESATDAIRGISSWVPWLQFLAVGPYAVGLATRAKYSKLRLEAHGLR